MTSEIGEMDLVTNDIRHQAAQHTLAANALVGVRGQDIIEAARILFAQMARNPSVAARQYLSLLGELGRIATGGSELAPDEKDRRFTDPAWKESAAYRALAQSYLAWGHALNRLVDDMKMEEGDTARARFVVALLVDAMSPTNSLGGNPTALKRLVDSGGASLVRGLGNFVNDLAWWHARAGRHQEIRRGQEPRDDPGIGGASQLGDGADPISADERKGAPAPAPLRPAADQQILRLRSGA
jgi:hypothetical protein